MPSPAWPTPGPALPGWRTCYVGTGRLERAALGAGPDLHRGRLQVRSGTAPQVMACLRNLAIGVLCRAGPVNLAAALRFHSRDPHRPLATLRISLGVGIPSQLPGDDAGAAPDSATSKPTSLAERSAGGVLRSQTSGTQPSPTLPGRAVPEQPGDLDGLLP